jgi:hypothetical protein
MPSERIQRQIDRLLDEAEQAVADSNWTLVQDRCRNVLALDPENADALSYLAAAERWLGAGSPISPTTSAEAESDASPSTSTAPAASVAMPDSFASGRYTVKKFLGEGGKKKVYLAHDTLLDRNVAFALIKTEGLDDIGRDRIKREAQAMGRLGAHPHIVSVFDLGEEKDGQPYIVTELMGGGDVEGLIEKAPEHRPPLERTLEISIEVCRGLEFAHAHGIVHRDLKPGNVWLTTEGTAKLGDFGLAVALDKTRLTQGGMMVGTVSYMPPEQAMGGEVTPRADLYALGAMLYEMVTGRPPFVGDESVAIITQHLNAQPVEPTWHNAAVPPALEVLILRLLEKDPAKRPASGTEVREILRQIGPGTRQPETAPATVVADQPEQNPVYRRAFVGREPELRQLQAAFDRAASGRGSLVMVVGEPGIGKTSLCEQLATYAVVRGGTTLVGHCYEEGSLSLPYLPLVEAMRSYVLAREPDALRSDLGDGAGAVARIVSEVRERLHVEPSPATADAEEDRYRLYQAVASFLRSAATVQPLVLVLEDLHDADLGTLDLLLHLSRNLVGARLLILGTYRDIEVDRAHPLSATLADLRRSTSFERILLRGLTADEVQRMLSQLSGQDAAWGLSEAVHRQTEGNPLFIQEVLRYLVEEGLVRREAGGWRRASSETPLELGIPEGLRDVIGKRLARLSPECNRLLATASVIGRDFTLATVQRVAGQHLEALSATLQEAVRTAVLTEQERVGVVQYRFAHAFFRQTLYEELGAARRIQVHQQVARALEEQYTTRLQDHAAELAEHFAHSSDRADLAKSVQYAELAAERAMSVYAYGEAVRHLEQALDVQEVLDPDDQAKRCDLLLALGEAMLAGGDLLPLIEQVAPQSLALAKEAGDSLRASHACRLALSAIQGQEGTSAVNSPGFRAWADEADRYAASNSADRVSADTHRASLLSFSDRAEEGWALLQRARVLAEALGDEQALAPVFVWTLINTWLPESQPVRLQVATEALRRIAAGAAFPSQIASSLVFGAAHVFVAWGDRERAEQAAKLAEELAGRTRRVQATLHAAELHIVLLGLSGELEAATRAAEELRLSSERLGAPGFGRNLARRSTLWPLLHLGRANEAYEHEAPLDRRLIADGGSLARSAATALCLAYAGRTEEVEQYLGQLRERLAQDGNALQLNVSSLVNYLGASNAVRDAGLARTLGARLSPTASLISEVYPTCIARHLGAASALLGERGQARAYYEQALEVCGRLQFRPEIALTHLGLAEMLLDDSNETNRSEGMQHLDTAIAEFRDMKMQPALERALRHKEVLKA